MREGANPSSVSLKQGSGVWGTAPQKLYAVKFMYCHNVGFRAHNIMMDF